jgi:hypothetical protein
MVGLGILSDYQSQLHVRKVRHEFLPPCRGAFGAWWQVTLFAGSGKTESYGQDSHPQRIIKYRVSEIQCGNSESDKNYLIEIRCELGREFVI